jgi:sialic acid synthase SpsE
VSEHVRIGDRLVGPGEPCYVIAEAGSNHNRDLDTAYRLVDVAAEAGADAIKFQTYSAERIYARGTPMAAYLEGTDAVKPGEDLFDLIKRIELPREWQPLLARRARERGIHFFSSPFDEQAVDELVAVGVPVLKIASFELTHFPLLRYAARTGLPLILSTGMAIERDIEEALDAIRAVADVPLALLHCVSTYPAPPEACNLRAMETMRRRFGVPVGFSDHTLGIAIDVAAAALGADLLEKHFTLDRRQAGPDHPFAVEPSELSALVEGVRASRAALGDGVKRPQPSEAPMRELRRGLVAGALIPKGKRVTEADVAVKRPGRGIQTRELPTLLGKKARRDIAPDEILRWEMFE